MGKSNEEVGAEFLLEVIDTVGVDERAAFDAIRSFVEEVDKALPGGGKQSTPSRRVEIVEAGLEMIEQLLGVSNDVARRLTESVRQALPAIERNVSAAAKKSAAKKSAAKKSAAKKSAAKKSAAKKSAAKKSAAKKSAAKKSAAKKSAAKKSAAKKSAAKKSAAKKSAAKKSAAKKSAAKKSAAKKTTARGS